LSRFAFGFSTVSYVLAEPNGRAV